MSDHDYGPLQTYELVWRSGHVEQIQAHKVYLPQPAMEFGGGMFTSRARISDQRQIRIYGEFNGEWTLVLLADEDDIKSIRLVTAGEPIPGEVAS